MSTHRNLDVLSAAEQVVLDIIALSDGRARPLLFRQQLQNSAQSVSANIGEAFGRGTIADRNRVLLIARAEAEETIRHLATNYKSGRLDASTYWRLHNRLVTIVKMLNALTRSYASRV